jgi:hypothetical protein
MSEENMEFIVWIIEVAATEFFGGDKTKAYNTLKNSKLWDLYVSHYDVSHTLGRGELAREMKEFFIGNGVTFP